MASGTGGEDTVRSLVAEGVRAVFGIPGTHGLALIDALHDAPEIRRITTRHEQGAAFMADGYARASGKVGVCLTPTGPGAVNSLTAMATAYADSSPVLNIFSQIPTAHIGRGKGYLHEVLDQLGMFSQSTGWSARAESVEAIPWLVREAMGRMRSGRHRPAALELPKDVLDATGDAPVLSPAPVLPEPPEEKQLAAAVEALLKASRPVVWAGGGVIAGGASSQLEKLSEALQAPVVTTVMGKGSMPEHHPLHIGCLAQHAAVQDYLAGCDLVLVVGSRLSALDTAEWALKLPGVLVHVDVDPTEFGRNYPVSIPVVGDAKLVLGQLSRMVTGASGDRPSRAGEVAELRDGVRRYMVSRSHEAVQLVEQVHSAVPNDGIVAYDLTTCAYWGWTLHEVYKPRTYLYPWGFGTLGFGLPAAMGAKVACPEKNVLAVCGDGGFLYTAAELATAVLHGINVVTLVVNDSMFGVLEPQQLARFGRTMMIDLHNPDLVALARSFGAYALRVDRVEEVGPALCEALAAQRPGVVEFQAHLPYPFDW